MGYVSFHLEKAKGNDAQMSAHIERTIDPANADKSRTHLNRELIEFSEGVKNRAEAIQHRIENAGITRKITADQVRVVRGILSGTHEDIKQIESDGKLDEWCADNLDWLKKTFGAENLVSAVLHMDEKTPHIHATIIPIVTGERRKAKQEQLKTGRKYKTKPINAPRLCADDVTARDKLKHYQDTYAEAMGKYGLQRGKEGSEAKHITTQQYYRELVDKNAELKEDNESLQEQKEEVYAKVRDLYDQKDEAREKFLEMDKHIRNKDKELTDIETKLTVAKQDYEPYKAQDELNLIHELFPMMKEQLRIADFCKKIGIAFESVKALFAGKSLTGNNFIFFSPEHNQKFKAENLKLKIEKEPDNPNKLRLNLNEMDILEWFREKYREVQQKLNIDRKPEMNKSKGVKFG